MNWLQPFFIGLGVIATLCFFTLLYFYRRRELEQEARQARMEADMADVLSLFQTMRDILTQQKNLAKEFNAEVDKKMTAVKQVLAQGIERNERLYETQRTLQQQLEDVRAEVQSLQRQSGYAREPQPAAPRPQRSADPQHRADSASAFKELADSLTHTPAAIPAATRPPADMWDADDTLPDVAAPEEPRDPGSARAAFRALLDLGPDEPETAPPPENGETAAGSPIQKRVLEYHAAGMSVAEIAKELGIGKGEIRLMLSLAK